MNPAVHEGTGNVSRRGTTLVEVMVACVILAVLALASAASLQYARSMSVQQRDRRTALELANSRLEDLRAAAYSNVWPSAQNYNLYYVRRSGTNWVVSSSSTNEAVKVNNRTRTLVSTVRYVDVDAGSASYDALLFNVKVQYGSSANLQVELETVRGP
jgi:prepilin-type N-terminal cleavage/methylation domain-containing protein